jgi:hypothetical protein
VDWVPDAADPAPAVLTARSRIPCPVPLCAAVLVSQVGSSADELAEPPTELLHEVSDVEPEAV